MVVKLKTKLYPFQRAGVAKLNAFNGVALLADDMGLGKTIQVLAYIAQHLKRLKYVLVVCPAYLKHHWEREAKVHLGLRAEVLSGLKPGKRWRPTAKLLIINYEILSGWVPCLHDVGLGLVVLDECQRVKNRAARCTLAAQALCHGLPDDEESPVPPVPHKIGISGTPFENNAAELWPILNILHPDRYPAFVPFAMKYTNRKRMRWGFVYEGAKNETLLNQRLRKLCLIRRRKENVLKDLPPKIRTVLALPLGTKLAHYQEARDDFINWLKKNDPEKVRGALRAAGLAHVGYLKRLAAELKMAAAFDWIDDTLAAGGKLLLFCIHKRIVAMLKERYKRQCVVVTGETPMKKRRLAFDRFNKDKRTPLFIGNLDAAGTGWSAQCEHVAALELGWVPTKHTQAEDRAHGLNRGVVGKRTRCAYLVGKGTIEETIINLLTRKHGYSDSILDGGKVSGKFDLFNELCKALRAEGNK